MSTSTASVPYWDQPLPQQPPSGPSNASVEAPRAPHGRGRGRRGGARGGHSHHHHLNGDQRPLNQPGSSQLSASAVAFQPQSSSDGIKVTRPADIAGASHEDGAAPGPSSSPTLNAAPPTAPKAHRNKQSNGKQKANGTHSHPPGETSEAVEDRNAAQGPSSIPNSRRSQFGGKLSANDGASQANPNNNRRQQNSKAKPSKPIEPALPPGEYADLRSRLVAELASGTYDCSICYSGISNKAAVWSCAQCSTVLHLSCIKQWASSSVKAAEEQNAMQEDPSIRERKGTWRCPGCQLAREEVPTVYLCWDGQMQDPKPSRNMKRIPPHSCGKPCSKASCIHGCSAGVCHPGPCPPCPVTLHHRCFCQAQEVAVRCSQLAKSQTRTSAIPDEGISCGQACNKVLNCSVHRCQDKCHPGDCKPCSQSVTERCYCGKNMKTLQCGQGQKKICDDGKDLWEGAWQCEATCSRLYDCGRHACQRACHPPSSTPIPCPFSPALVSTCPCGATSLASRSSCEDPITTCDNICNKPFANCSHTCREKCHLGDCPPCTVPVSAPCRCGESRPTLPCSQRTQSESEGSQDVVLCDVVCRSLRHCGRHECKRRCCPLAFQAKQSKKQQSRARAPTQAELDEQDPARLHACPVPCAKPLSCGKEGHTCPLHCHRGPCPPCLQACFEDVACHCGRTVLEPPVPCGQRPVCRFPCARPPPACGHPKLPHDCHESGPCPPCVYLTTKQCDCGKNMVQNVPCHRQRVSCGNPCGALKPCGFHRCTMTCHSNAPQACGECTAICGKPKRKCGHPCKDRCHAPARCDESKPCDEVINISCPCGQLKQKTRCGCSSNGAGPADRQLKCNETCQVAQRNAKLAEALGLDVGEKTAPPSYPASLLAFYGQDHRFAREIEGLLTDFIRSPRHSLILPSATRSQRQFTHELAGTAFGLLTESLDSEPKRSVQVRRTGEARVPKMLPSEAWEKAKREVETSTGSSSSRLTQMRPAGNGTSTPSHNALLLDGVFGVDEESLRELLTTAPSPAPVGSAPLRLIPFTLRWVTDETVVVATPDGNVSHATHRLLAAKADVSRLLKMNRCATTIVACSFDSLNNRVVRREDRPGGSVLASRSASPVLTMSMSRGGSQSGAPATKLSGWAAVASALPTPSTGTTTHTPVASSSRPSAASTASSWRSTTTKPAAPTATDDAVRRKKEETPEEWDAE